jgi:hypothetical protein
MPKVELAHDVYAALQRRAVPLEDDINDVLRRLLRADRGTHVNGPVALNGSPAAGRALNAVPTDTDAAVPATDDYRGAGSGDIDSGAVIVHRRTPTGDHLAQSTVRSAVLGILRSSREVVSITALFRAVERQLRNRMTDGDLEMLPSGITQWQVQVRNALTQLQHEGHIERIRDDLYRSRAKHMTG